jgi:hypothetical protein
MRSFTSKCPRSPRRRGLGAHQRGVDHTARITRPEDYHNTAANIALPQLSEDAAVQIQDFIHHVPDLFEAYYGDQIARYYDDRSQHNATRPDTPDTIDDPPF